MSIFIVPKADPLREQIQEVVSRLTTDPIAAEAIMLELFGPPEPKVGDMEGALALPFIFHKAALANLIYKNLTSAGAGSIVTITLAEMDGSHTDEVGLPQARLSLVFSIPFKPDDTPIGVRKMTEAEESELAEQIAEQAQAADEPKVEMPPSLFVPGNKTQN